MDNSFFELPSTIRGVNLPNDGQMTSEVVRSTTYCFGLDWIEFTALASLNELPERTGNFSHEDSGHGSKYYNDLYNVQVESMGQKLPFATIQAKPRPSFLDPNLVQIKIDNRFCYTPNIGVLIGEFCLAYGFAFKNFTRLDVFVDFQNVDYYGFSVQHLMKDFAARKVVCKGKSMTVHHKREEVTGITWGARSSGMSITMYNKTLEMLKKSWKPWIELLWGQAGFDMEKDVYRLEFSMKKPKADIINRHAETLCSFDDITMVYSVKPILDYCYHNHWQLAIGQDGVRFSRLDRFYPLNLAGTGFYPTTSCIKPKSNNYTKAYIKRLAVDALFYQKSGNKLQASCAYRHLMDVVERHSLDKWFGRKFYWLDLRQSRMTVWDCIVVDQMQNRGDAPNYKNQTLTQSYLFN